MTPRILHVLSQRPGRSGSGVFLQALVREAAHRGYRQHAIVAGPPQTSASELPPLADEQLSLVAFPSPRAPFDVPGNSDVMPYPSTVFAAMTEVQVEQYLDVARRAMLRARERFRPDLVHTHHLWLMTALAGDVFTDVPVVATSHHAELRQAIKASHLMGHVIPGVRALDRIGVLTPRSIDDVVDAFGADRARVRWTGAGFDPRVFAPPADGPDRVRERLREHRGVALPAGRVVTFVGRLSTPKGVPSLIRACVRARERVPGLRLVLVGATGSGADGAGVQAIVDEHPQVVCHVGAQPPEVVADILRCSDLFVLPSLFEGLGLTTLEAAACGCRVMVSDLPTIRSFVPRAWEHQGGFVLHPPPVTTDVDVPVASEQPRYVEGLASAIADVLERPWEDDDRRRLGAELEQHSWSAVFDRYEAIYADLVDGRAGA